MDVFDAPRGRGPYGISTTPNGDVYYASLAGSYVGRIDTETGQVDVLNPPTPGQGARRVWPDSRGRIWVSQWYAGQVAVYDPATEQWQEWKLPGARPSAYAVYVDETDMVWLSDFGANTIVRFNPLTEQFDSFELPSQPSEVRQLLGRPGEVWAPESAGDQLVVIRFRENLAGDFNGDGTLDVMDINLLTEQLTAAEPNLSFDLTNDAIVDEQDRRTWIEDLKITYYGDATLDGEFDSRDLVAVFAAGQYEDSIEGNSTWETGDWNGNAEFESGDLVTAMSQGGYELGPRANGAVVPEPSSVSLIIAAAALVAIGCRRCSKPRDE
jgi:sugar lactone lactonase YvrE